MRPEVAEEWILNTLEGFCPRFQGRHMVDADAQHLGIQPREPGGLRLVSRDLRASGRGKGQGEKGKHHVAAAIFAQANISIEMAGQAEIRGLLTYM
jgi:hypothetical protein